MLTYAAARDTLVAQLRADARVQMHLHAGGFELAAEVADRLVEFLLAGNALGHVELAADLAGAIEQVHVVAALCEHG